MSINTQRNCHQCGKHKHTSEFTVNQRKQKGSLARCIMCVNGQFDVRETPVSPPPGFQDNDSYSFTSFQPEFTLKPVKSYTQEISEFNHDQPVTWADVNSQPQKVLGSQFSQKGSVTNNNVDDNYIRKCSLCRKLKPNSHFSLSQRKQKGSLAKCTDCCTISTEPDDRKCASCGVLKPNSCFSVSQRKQKGSMAKCMDCCSLPPECETQKQWCEGCEMLKNKADFSKSQRSKYGSIHAKCKVCVLRLQSIAVVPNIFPLIVPRSTSESIISELSSADSISIKSSSTKSSSERTLSENFESSMSLNEDSASTEKFYRQKQPLYQILESTKLSPTPIDNSQILTQFCPGCNQQRKKSDFSKSQKAKHVLNGSARCKSCIMGTQPQPVSQHDNFSLGNVSAYQNYDKIFSTNNDEEASCLTGITTLSEISKTALEISCDQEKSEGKILYPWQHSENEENPNDSDSDLISPLSAARNVSS